MRRIQNETGMGRAERDQEGAVMIAIVFLLVPLVLVTGAFLLTMNSRTTRLVTEIADEHAFQAAEAGVDAAIYEARIGNLTSGVDIVQALPGGSSFVATPTYLGADSVDNDGDLSVDEPDEDLFQVVVTGTHRREQRRLAAYLGRTSFLPSLTSAFATHNPSMTIDLNGNPLIDGKNYDISGALGDPTYNGPGLAIAPPGTTNDLLGELSGSEQNKVDGLGGTPSLGTTPAIDLPTLVEEARNAASIVLTNSTYSSFNFGDASLGTGFITFREGNVRFTGNTRGAGLLVVTGNLEMMGNFRFDGVIVVLGDFDNGAGTAQVYGSVITGPATSTLNLRGTSNVYFSKEAIDLASNLAGRYVAFNGWQEISRN